MIADGPLDLTVWYDYHCPYSYRVTAWLLGLGPAIVRPHFRPFPLEQVNRDAAASTWRLWEQPLDYAHQRDRPDRRPLQAFLATAILEADEAPPVVDRFRLAVYRTRFDDGGDISDIALLGHLAAEAGADPDRLVRTLGDEPSLADARAGIAAAWRVARARYAIFGVPTLEPEGERPVYLRLERAVSPGPEANDLLTQVRAMWRGAPIVVEMKVPDLTDPVPPA